MLASLKSLRGLFGKPADPWALAKQERFLEALRAGEAANRRAPDVALQKAMVVWRNRVPVETGLSPSIVWPWTPSDPFPQDVNCIPEIGPERLNTEVLAGALHHHGSLLVRNFIDPETVAELKAGIDEAFAARERTAQGGDGGAFYAPADEIEDPDLAIGRVWLPYLVLTADSPAVLARWVDLLREKGVFDLVEGYIGERPVLSLKKATLYRLAADRFADWYGTYRQGSERQADWHQDGAFLGEGIRTVNIWVALSDCGKDAPGLDIVPWRLPGLAPTNTHGAKFDWTVGHGQVEELAGGRALATPEFKAGDALLIDQLCLHRTGGAPGMTGSRYAMETWMFAPSTYADRSRLVV